MGHGATAVRGAYVFIGSWTVLLVMVNFAPLFGTLFKVWLIATLVGTPLVLAAFAFGMVDAALLDRGVLPYWQIVIAASLSLVILAVLLGFLMSGWDRATPSWFAAYALTFLLAITTLVFAPMAWRGRRQAARRLIKTAYAERQQDA